MSSSKRTSWGISLVLAALVCAWASPAVARVVSVKDFGAVGNGMADDTQAFKDALKATEVVTPPATELATVVYVPAGTYLITDELVLKNCAVTVRGDNSLTSTILSGLGSSSGNVSVFHAGLLSPECASLRIADLGFELSSPNGRALKIYNAQSIVLDRLRLRASNSAQTASNRTVGIELATSGYATGVRINNSLFSGVSLGVYFQGYVTGSSVQGSSFFGPRAGATQYPSQAIFIGNLCNGISILNNVIEGWDLGVESWGIGNLVGFNRFEQDGVHILFHVPGLQSTEVANAFY